MAEPTMLPKGRYVRDLVKETLPDLTGAYQHLRESGPLSFWKLTGGVLRPMYDDPILIPSSFPVHQSMDPVDPEGVRLALGERAIVDMVLGRSRFARLDGAEDCSRALYLLPNPGRPDDGQYLMSLPEFEGWPSF